MASLAAAVALPNRLPVAAGPQTIENHIDSQQIKMTAISTAFKATESAAASTVATSSQLSTSVGPSTASVVGVSPDHNKYLHKKFKRIASTTLEPHAAPANTASSRYQPTHSHQHADQTQRTVVPNGQHVEDGKRIKVVPIVNQYSNHSTDTTRQELASNSQTSNTFSGSIVFNETTEANSTAKTNTPQSTPPLHKNNHLNHNNNYSNQHNNNNNIAPTQHQQPQILQNGTSTASLIYIPTLASHKLNGDSQEQLRPFYYVNSPSPNLQDGQSVALRSTPDHAVDVLKPSHQHQQQQRFQQQMLPQQHQFQQLTVSADRTISPSINQQQPQVQQQPAQQLPATSESPTPGRYVCPFCQLNCAKPSVLQKHIRAHTNERPYPCEPCGFAFKTRSNLYKHRR